MRFFTNSGVPWKQEYIPRVEKDGTITLIEGEKTNFQEYIESFRDETDIENIIARFNNGDVNALSKAQGFYGDVKGIPKTYAEILNLVKEGEYIFDRLPVEVKREFDNDFNKWFVSMGSERWFDIMATPDQKFEKDISEKANVSEVEKE